MNFFILLCSSFILINNTQYPWNEHDMDVLKRTQKRCGEIYQESPCLKKFVKNGFNNYWVYCGAAE